jgi:hypothetical protein
MMVQTGMAPSHGRGTKHHLPIHYYANRHRLLLHQMGNQPPNLSPTNCPSTKSSQAAPPTAQTSSKASIQVPLVQAAHEKEEEMQVSQAKATVQTHMAIQSINTHRQSPPRTLPGWLSRGALRLQLFVRCKLFSQLQVTARFD